MELATLEAFLGIPPPPSVASLYAVPSELDANVELMRLLPPEEATRETKLLRQSSLELDPDILILWSDDHSNYGGVYFRGRLAPRVVLIDHEEPELTPHYFSVESFVAARRNGAADGLSWYELPTDYPVLSATQYPLLESDRELALEYLEAFRQDPESIESAFHALNLLPPHDFHLIRELVWAEDMWIQERACEIIGRRNYEQAIDDLYQVALRGGHNGRVAAILALKRMSHPSARARLNDLRHRLEPRFAPYFR